MSVKLAEEERKQIQELVIASLERSMQENYNLNKRVYEIAQLYGDIENPLELLEKAMKDEIAHFLVSFALVEYYRGFLTTPRQAFDVMMEFVLTIQKAGEKYIGTYEEYLKEDGTIDRASEYLGLIISPDHLNKEVMISIFQDVYQIAKMYKVKSVEVYRDEILFRELMRTRLSPEQLQNFYMYTLEPLWEAEAHFEGYILPKVKKQNLNSQEKLTEEQIMSLRMEAILNFCEDNPDWGHIIKDVKKLAREFTQEQLCRFFGPEQLFKTA